MNAFCCYCNRMFDIRYLTIHTIIAHNRHEEPTYREYKIIEKNPLIYYSVKFLYDDNYQNILYSPEINRRITDAIIRSDPTIDIEFMDNGIKKHHLINLYTMKIINISTKLCSCFDAEELYDLVLYIDKNYIYRSVLINNSNDKMYPLRAEYFKHIAQIQDK